MSSTVRTGAALAGAAGIVLLAGCSGTDAAPADAGTGGAEYTDGTYTAEGSYQTPETIEEISVTMTLADGEVTDVEVTGNPHAPETEQYQGQFIDGIAEEVEGRPIDELDVSRVAGSSLTSAGFNAAVEEIKAQAAS
jgi:uncharacterized protein with FMN-binding domain